MRVAIICETSGEVRRAFRKRGHDAYSYDLLPSDDNSPYHIVGDARDADFSGYDLMISHPTCTRLCNSGVCWLHQRNLWNELDEAAKFFRYFIDAPIPKKCIENPIPHKYALERIGVKYSQIIQPYQFGHPERKATCLWLFNLPPLLPTALCELPKEKKLSQRIHYTSPGPDRWKIRSRTFPGIAKAMAEQWG